jgi:hypothetical protein
MRTVFRKAFTAALAAAALVAGSGPALASPTCTKEPKDKWIPESEMKQKIADMGYKDIRTFKVTSGNCYEIYGSTKDGKKAEVYFNPVTAEIVKQEIGK